MNWIVSKEVRVIGGTPTVETRYLGAIAYDPYQKYTLGEASSYLSPNVEDAYIFTRRTAAEVAAVFIGGEVQPALSPQ